ncbi:hypothetical protein BD309DRAFT_505405 [Dichomitus squalens]|nr:hypothetical protein BD309DRAFT_505405 [Dichomitus squalens]
MHSEEVDLGLMLSKARTGVHRPPGPPSASDVATAPAVLTDLEAFDMMADVLAQGAQAVPIELLLKTTLRALGALGTLLDGCVAACSTDVSRSRLGSSADASSGAGSRFRHESGFASVSTGSSAAASGVRHPLAALSLVDSTLHRLIPAVFSSLSAHAKKGKAAAKTASAVDEVLGWVYALVLNPLVLAFAPVSGSFLSACLRPQSKSNSSSRVSYGGNSPLSRLPAAIARGGTDLRPTILDLLDKTLSALEAQSVAIARGSSAAAAGAGTNLAHGRRGGNGTSNPNPNRESATDLGAHAISGVCAVKRLLALVCVRELERMYAPLSCAYSHGRDAELATTPDARSSSSSDAALGNTCNTIGNTRPSSGREARHSLPRDLLLALLPGSAYAYAHGLGGGSGTSEDPTRPGTAAVGPSSPDQLPLPQSQSRASATGWAYGTPRSLGALARAAGNLGETRVGGSSGGGRGPVCEEAVRRASGASSGFGLEFTSTPRAGFWDQDRLARVAAAAAGATAGAAAATGDDDLRADALDDKTRERMTWLARKDAAWYLCAALNRLLPCSAAALSPAQTAAASYSSSTPRPEPTDTVAEQAVYAALADLLRRTRPSTVAAFPDLASGPSADGKETLDTPFHEDPAADRDVTQDAETHGHGNGSERTEDDRHERMQTQTAGTMVMGEVERTMLLAVLERAWLGV